MSNADERGRNLMCDRTLPSLLVAFLKVSFRKLGCPDFCLKQMSGLALIEKLKIRTFLKWLHIYFPVSLNELITAVVNSLTLKDTRKSICDHLGNVLILNFSISASDDNGAPRLCLMHLLTTCVIYAEGAIKKVTNYH